MVVGLIVDTVKIWCRVTTWMGRVQTDVNPDIHKTIVHNIVRQERMELTVKRAVDTVVTLPSVLTPMEHASLDVMLVTMVTNAKQLTNCLEEPFSSLSSRYVRFWD